MNKRSAGVTKSCIIDAARRVFAENGYAEASMRLIAQAADISVGCLYIHFKNKEDLYLTLMQQWIKDLEARTDDVLAGVGDPADAVRAFVAVTIDFAAEHREMILLQGRELGFSLGRELKREFFRRRRHRLVGLIEDGVKQGVFFCTSPEDAAKVIFNALRGFVFSMVIDEEALFSSEACCAILLNGLLRRNNE